MPFPPNAADLIATKIDAGMLPRHVVGKAWAGYGTGLLCDGCETRTLRAQVYYEFDTVDGGTVRFHVGCAALWESALRRRGIDPRPLS